MKQVPLGVAHALPPGWALSVLPGSPIDQFDYWPPNLEQVANGYLPEAFTGLAVGQEGEEVIFLCFVVRDGQVNLTTVMSSTSDVHTALDRLRKAAPMDRWKRWCVVGMAQFLATADPEELAKENAENGFGDLRQSWSDAAEAWRKQFDGRADENITAAQTMPLRRTRRNRITREHLMKVADVYRTADEEGAPPTRAVQRAFGTTHSTAAKWVSAARKKGILGPAAGPRGGELEITSVDRG